MKTNVFLPNKPRICIIGLGYVGLPLAVEFGKLYDTIGYEINKSRVEELRKGIDKTLEVETNQLNKSNRLRFTNKAEDIDIADIFIVTVPTPIDKNKKPDLKPIISATELLGKIIRKDSIIIYESTVYPGVTEEICAPILSKISNLIYNEDFFLGYSPERINPGDKSHRVSDIIKVTSGSTDQISDYIDNLYKSIITAGTFKATSIKVAEAAKVIENTQRDINIALINELAIIFSLLNIDTSEVLAAAGSKWNFLPFKPGLVGGHCIGVDPYYLTYKAQEVGYNPEIILAGRRLNDNMGKFIANQVIKCMLRKRIQVADSRILILGLTFKENCPDLRNTRVIDIYTELKTYNAKIDVYDPLVDKNSAEAEYGIDMIERLKESTYDAIILAVAHEHFKNLGSKYIKKLGRQNSIIYDIKSILSLDDVDERL
ncbi:Vi polysaccharide biosynthesis UDP-N-acetylglucosamine C-6 dehydrogenase TviB [Amylibacter sp.]|nr:Vi polysaccharide biosynthesis UDP-N-acetylglucosamine C-6 dehydrogenase TviB [Amylibacter sp.]